MSEAFAPKKRLCGAGQLIDEFFPPGYNVGRSMQRSGVIGTESKDIRFKQRLENFSKSCALLSEINGYELPGTPVIVREGFIQRFEVTFELLWKTLKDYLEYSGIHMQSTPRAVIKEAFAAKVISDGQIFIDMLDARNLMSHSYDEETFTAIFSRIKRDFYPAIEKLRADLERCGE
jgi:nucleotidyltransferase substrate binding protein (TIGR01987 family)